MGKHRGRSHKARFYEITARQGGKLSARQSRELTKLGLVDGRPLNFPSILLTARGIVLAPATHETDIAAPALPAHQPLGPVQHRRLGAVAFGQFGRVGLDLVEAIAAPHRWM